MTLSPGTLLQERYRIVSILGQGGMGAVYKADDEHLGIHVAVKENLFLSDEYTRQFQREAGILASLRHPSLPRVGDYFVVNGQGQYLIMDYIEGEDLRQRIERINALPPQDVILIGAMICDALAYLHSRTPPIVHRDIKPGNIKITPEGEVCLVDFGLAKFMLDDQVTTTGARAMTPGYSPPEQYGTARTDPRSDIYSLGATLYAALTGIIPEDGLARATGKARLTGIRQIQQSIDRRLALVIEKALEVEPENRYQTAEEFKTVLLEVANINPTTQRRLVITPPPSEEHEAEPGAVEVGRPMPRGQGQHPKPRRRNSSIPIFLSTVFIIAVIGFLYFRPDVVFAIASRFIPSPSPVISITSTPPQAEAATPTQTIHLVDTQQNPAVSTATSLAATVVPALIPTTATVEATGSPTPNITPVGGTPGQIAFVSNRSGTMQLWLMNSDGSNQRQLTSVPEGVCEPSWSPDGKSLAFISPCTQKQNETYPNASIYLMDADGSNIRLMPRTQVGDFDPAWSPDGNRIAFASIRNEIPHIFVVNLTDNSLSEISNTRHADFQPTWRAGGKQIAFVRKSFYNHIWIMSELGDSQFQISSNGDVNDYWPVWSSNGDFVLFARSSVPQLVPWLVYIRYEDRGNGRETRIPAIGAPDLGPMADPTLSPDNQWVAFEGWPDGRNHDIFLVDIGGTKRVRLTTDPGLDFSPIWRPAPQ